MDNQKKLEGVNFEDGWKINYDPAIRFIELSHPEGGRQTVCECSPEWAERIIQALTHKENPENVTGGEAIDEIEKFIRNFHAGHYEKDSLDYWLERVAIIRKRLQALTPASVDVEALHSKIDMDVEDSIGRDITMEESIIIGEALKALSEQGLLHPSDHIVDANKMVGEPVDVGVLEWLDENGFDLRCDSVPIADTGDYDIVWHVYSHWMAEPQLRSEGMGATPLGACKDAGFDQNLYKRGG